MLARAMAATATVVALAFTLALHERWRARRRAHERSWTVSMALFTVASGALLWGVGVGWSPFAFRCFYYFGAIVNVPWLALGSVELLAGPRWGRPLRRWLALGSAFAAGVVLEAPLRAAVPTTGLPTGKELFGPAPRVLAAVASGVGALVVIAGALWSAWRLWRGRHGEAGGRVVSHPGRLAAGNVVIATGTTILGLSGTLAGRLGAATAFAVTLAAGVVVLFAGFLVATAANTTGRRNLAPWLAEVLHG